MEIKTFTDPRDGKVYKTVKIGEQVWMAENLNFECEWSVCYDNDPSNAKKYGRLYFWVTANKVCPPGWHLPSNEEWGELVNFVGGEEIAGEKLKAKSGWNENGSGTDEYGFSALPGGVDLLNGYFDSIGYSGFWWSASKNENYNINTYLLSMTHDCNRAYLATFSTNGLFSVRCVQNKAYLPQEQQRQEKKAEIKTETFTDPRDGKVYKTVKIGEQVWMAENLNFECEGSKCYDNDPKNAEKYGRLYDWKTAMEVCPPGWHLPSIEELDELVNFAGGKKIAGEKLKVKSGWNQGGNGTDEYGFSALPGGSDYLGSVGDDGYWWSASDSEYGSDEAYLLSMKYDSDDASWWISDKSVLHYVRCLQDKARRDVV